MLRHRTSRSPRERGFTLIEVLIVLTIISIVAAIAIPAMGFAIDKSKQRATMSDMRMIAGAITLYYMDHSIYPTGPLSGFKDDLAVYVGDYIPTQDRWYTDFTYLTDQKNQYTLESHGRDGLDGTNISYATRYDFNLDIVWETTRFSNIPDL